MTIIWHGQSCFQILTTPNKNHSVKIVIDPYNESIGLRPPLALKRGEFDILLITHNHQDHNNIKAVGGSSRLRQGEAGKPFLIEGPGEYEIKETYINGIPGWHDDQEGKERGGITIYTIETENIRICHLGDLGQKKLTDEQVEKIGDVDILMIPVGGGPTIDAGQAKQVIEQIGPKLVIPMHYQIPGLNKKLDNVNNFLKIMGKKPEPIEKLTIKDKDLPAEGPEVVVLKP